MAYARITAAGKGTETDEAWEVYETFCSASIKIHCAFPVQVEVDRWGLADEFRGTADEVARMRDVVAACL